MKIFSISDTLKFGWEQIKANSRLVFSAVLILAAIQLLTKFAAPDQSSFGGAGVLIFGGILELIFGTGFTIMVLKLSRGEHAELREIIPPGRLLWQTIATSFLVALMMLLVIAIPVVLLMFGLRLPILSVMLGALIGGAIAVWIVLRYFFIKFVAIDGVHSVREILTASATLSQGIQWRLLLFLIVIALINIIGAITYIGLLLSIPITMFAMSQVYLNLKGTSVSATSQTPVASQPVAVE